MLELQRRSLLQFAWNSERQKRWGQLRTQVRSTFWISKTCYSLYSVIFAILTLPMPKGISQANPNPYLPVGTSSGWFDAKWHKLCNRTHAKWHEFRQNLHKLRQILIIRWADFKKVKQAGGSRERYLLPGFWAATVAAFSRPRLPVKATCTLLNIAVNNIERIWKCSIPISCNSRNKWWMIVWFLVDRNIQKVDGPFLINLPKPRILKVNNVSQQKAKKKYLEEIIQINLFFMCCDRTKIECEMRTGRMQFMMPLAEDARSKFKQTRWRP